MVGFLSCILFKMFMCIRKRERARSEKLKVKNWSENRNQIYFWRSTNVNISERSIYQQEC